MKKILISAFVLLLIASTTADYDPAYFRDHNDGFTERKRWMADVDEESILSQMAIPVTHDSSADGDTGVVKDFYITQCLNFDEQLRMESVSSIFVLRISTTHLRCIMTRFF